MKQVAPQPQPVAPVELEPRPITFIGGPQNGRTRADRGQTEWTDPETGDYYRRVRMDVGDRHGTLVFWVMGYFGARGE